MQLLTKILVQLISQQGVNYGWGSTLTPAERTTMRVSLQPWTEGIYIVVWRAVTGDTHKTEGAFIFRIGE